MIENHWPNPLTPIHDKANMNNYLYELNAHFGGFGLCWTAVCWESFLLSFHLYQAEIQYSSTAAQTTSSRVFVQLNQHVWNCVVPPRVFTVYDFCAYVFSPYGQGCFFCSGMTGLFLRKLSKLGPCRPRGSSGGMNLRDKKDSDALSSDYISHLQWKLIGETVHNNNSPFKTQWKMSVVIFVITNVKANWQMAFHIPFSYYFELKMSHKCHSCLDSTSHRSVILSKPVPH